MSLVIAHMQKNRKYSSITCLMFNSLYTHGINWEWLWVRNYEHTHRPTHRVASGINSVMGLKKTKQEEETRRTQTLFSALSRVPLHTEMRLWEVRECFLVFCRAGQESEQRRGVFQLQKQNRKKATSVTRWQAAASWRWWSLWWIWAASAAVQLSPRSSVLSKTYQKYRLVKPDKRLVNF